MSARVDSCVFTWQKEVLTYGASLPAIYAARSTFNRVLLTTTPRNNDDTKKVILLKRDKIYCSTNTFQKQKLHYKSYSIARFLVCTCFHKMSKIFVNKLNRYTLYLLACTLLVHCTYAQNIDPIPVHTPES